MVKVLFAGGGTGGHLVPGLNLAEALSHQNGDSSVLFLTGGRLVELMFFQKRSQPCKAISSLKKLSWKKPWSIFLQSSQCLHSLKQFKPNLSVGLGSSSSVVPLLAAKVQGVPFVLVEQNVVPGRATRFLSKWADWIACQWQESLHHLRGAKKKAHFTGPLLSTQKASVSREEARRQLTLSSDKPTLLVMGGSQGAQAINRIVLNNISQLQKRRDRCQVIHLTGVEDGDQLYRAYRRAGVDALVAPFHFQMPLLYAAADMILCRGGGTTLAEITACGLPAVILPYPWHRDRHQYKNAEVLVKKGSAVVVEQRDCTQPVFRRTVMGLLDDPARMESMRLASQGVFPMDGTNSVLQRIESSTKGLERRAG